MILFRTPLRSTLALAALAVNSCISPPNFPTTPSIEFKDMTVTRVDDGVLTAYDRVTITVSFQDGEGDLGLRKEDKTDDSPYRQYLADGSPNRNYNNYFLVPYYRTSDGQYAPVEFGNAKNIYISTYPPLDPAGGKAAPLKGDLTYTTEIPVDGNFTPIKQGQDIRFELSIMDRGLHESNKIVTPSYRVQ
ncbi:hypothetical protein SAMN02745146_1804 [Hymenobacter daecheongensis DSM 21074]|uniref:Lipoprotein n=1 Tax=Hymenobacter daecheongensis DSM 21074 TaxID=1121955 RepID=A0A1M6ET42_9BACT|nr:hypothetical protein [Hymenobacter daecheongensis]SHI88651.1 hypothetical protein SAMN02745146_1804 [Hymenobacter daecheongensis DSM 21074]